MDQVKVFYDHEGQTLTVWFDDPTQESVSEETAEAVIMSRTKSSYGTFSVSDL